MIRVQKFKFGNRFESFETKNIKVATKALKTIVFVVIIYISIQIRRWICKG